VPVGQGRDGGAPRARHAVAEQLEDREVTRAITASMAAEEASGFGMRG
jgi:hypothetical protein